jgi:hypothetical protein
MDQKDSDTVKAAEGILQKHLLDLQKKRNMEKDQAQIIDSIREINAHSNNEREATISPNIGLHVWLMTSKQTEPDLHFAAKQTR